MSSKRYSPVPSTKNGLRSEKNVSKAVRLTTEGSASTWPKSGFTVASSVTFGVMPTLMSPPAVISWLRSYRELGKTRCTFFVTAYGVTSTRRSTESPERPSSRPSCDESPFFVGDQSGQLDRSASRSMSRQMPKPKVVVDFW